MTKGAIRAVAHDAVDEATGARGLVTVLERTFRDLKVRRRRERPCAALFRARIVLLGTTFLSDARAPRPPPPRAAERRLREARRRRGAHPRAGRAPERLLADADARRLDVARNDTYTFEPSCRTRRLRVSPIDGARGAAAEAEAAGLAALLADRRFDAPVVAPVRKLAERTSVSEFELTENCVLDPELVLDEWLAATEPLPDEATSPRCATARARGGAPRHDDADDADDDGADGVDGGAAGADADGGGGEPARLSRPAGRRAPRRSRAPRPRRSARRPRTPRSRSSCGARWTLS